MIPKSGDRFSDKIMRERNVMTPRLDIVIPVYNEGNIILATLAELRRQVPTPSRILICYDLPDDDTLSTIKANPERVEGLTIEFVRNQSRGAHAAVMAGFAASRAPFVLVFPADDDFNAGIIDAMVAKGEQGADVVCASRFMPGGCMVGCRWLKAMLVRTAAFTLYYLARLPTRDATNGFRLFSRRVIDTHRDRIRQRILLQPGNAGKVPSARLAGGRRAGQMVRAQARRQPFPGAELGAGLSALVFLRFCDHVVAPAGK